jgi:hypothetical protein
MRQRSTLMPNWKRDEISLDGVDDEIKRESEYRDITYWAMKPDARHLEREVHSWLDAVLRADELAR